ncbi:putative aminopeptidase YsdC [Posidoniimonas polymericola]|uniref:Putative aminopeptidase YsdC n=1 Tax=Posidoniimonas polymericola TaxID=2528002 RepID=A0A5C5YPY5_9BACT|nr:M42 family metallopeptidase [Posidoniimonas polymericola]TWT77011.1 putative aminopeptidase YsdC [Posidoniimonas polymericola]
MTPEAKTFFQQILETPSPSGFEQPVQQLVRDYAKPFADDIRTDLHGNVIVSCNPDAPLRIMFAGHADQIGLIVTYIDEFGFIYTNTIGGWDPQQLIGQRMTIHTASGTIPAVIARKAIHLLDEQERKQVVKTKELWLDIGAKDQKEAAEAVAIGDPVTLQLGYQEMRNNLANSPGMDDKTGLWVCMEGARRAVERGGLKVAVHAVATVQEEVGLRGAATSAYGVHPHVGIAVDVTHATDCPTIDKTQEGDVKLGGGPVVYRGPNFNPEVVKGLRAAGEKADIGLQWCGMGRPGGTDANAIQLARGGVAAGLVSVPNRYMHSAVEMISLDDIDQCADLLAEFALGVAADADFTPR